MWQSLITLTALVLGFVNSADPPINFLTDLPSHYNLIKGDIVRIPISDYVPYEGAQFLTNVSAQFPNAIEPSVYYLKDIDFKESLIERCEFMEAYSASVLVMVCNNRYLVKAQVSSGLLIRESLTYVELASTIPTENQECSDMFIQNGFAYVACSDRIKKDTDQSLVVYTVTIEVLTMKYTSCNNKVKGRLRMVPTSSDTAPNKMQVIFFDYTPYTPVAGTIPFTKCIVSTQDKVPSSCLDLDLAKLAGIANLAVSIRMVSFLSSTEVMFVLADDSAGAKLVKFIIANVDSNGDLIKSKFPIKDWGEGPGTVFEPAQLAVNVETKTESSYISMVSLKTTYLLTMTFDRTTNPNEYLMNIAQPAMSTLDCGLAGDSNVFVGRVSVIDRNPKHMADFRQLVEYRFKDSNKLKSFSVKLMGSNYACSKNSPITETKTLFGVTIFSKHFAIVSTDDKSMLSTFRVQQESYLQLDTKDITTTDNKVSIEITARLKGFEDGKKVFTFTLYNDYRDQVKVTLPTSKFETYPDSTFGLPYISSNFIGNNLEFKTNMPNVAIKYAKSFTPTMTNFVLPEGYSIERVFAVDHDTFVAVLSKKGSPTQYLPFFGVITGENLVLTPSTISQEQSLGTNLFKAFKIGSDIYCMVFKGFTAGATKLSIGCHEDKKDGVIKLERTVITNNYEVLDIQFLYTSQRVDMIMIAEVTKGGSMVNELLHYYVKVDTSGKIATAVNLTPIDLVHEALADYVPIDAMFDFIADTEGTNHVTILMGSKLRFGFPLIAKFSVKFEGDSPKLGYLRHMNLKKSDVSYCVNKNEIILYYRKSNELFAQQFSKPYGIPNENMYQFPLKALGIQYVIQFECIPEKSMFQILGVDANKKKFLITYRGGDSANGGRRVHSVVAVENANNIEPGYNEDYLVTVASTPGATDLKRSFVQVYTEGPKFYVDNRGKTESYQIQVTSQTPNKKVDTPIDIQIIKATTSAKVEPKSQFSIKKDGLIFLDEVANIAGPVMDVQLVGNKDDITGVSLTKRNNKFKGLNIGSTERPDKVLAKGDFFVAMKFQSYIKIMGDPTITREAATAPYSITEKIGNIRDVVLTKLGVTGEVAVIYKEFIEGEFTFNLIILRKVKDIDNKDVYLPSPVIKIWDTKQDYEDMQIAGTDGDIIVAMKTRKELISNFIKLLAIKKDPTTNTYKLDSNINAVPSSDRMINTYSLVDISRKSVALIASAKGTNGFLVGIWNTYAQFLSLVETKTLVEYSPTEKFSLEYEYVRCWSNNGVDTVSCVVGTESTTDLLIDVTFNSLYEIDEKDRITSMVVKGKFVMPPGFRIKRSSKSNQLYTFLVERLNINNIFDNKRLLQGQTSTFDKISDCNQLILSYKPTVSENIFTGITCSEWNKAASTDMSTELIGGREYIFYTKDAPADPSKAPEGTSNERVNVNFISGITLQFSRADIDPSKITLKFVGLNGQDAPENQQLSLDKFQQGTPAPAPASSSSSAWIWILIIIILLAVVGGGVYYYMRNQSSSGGSSNKEDLLKDKDDMEDVRL